ncbi:MAG: hypothetical protein DDG60_02130 [Anaerolineae bacterium]|nr:MAG: hypothetical protein DDG60_02130 [Anaerolineae bacterium]
MIDAIIRSMIGSWGNWLLDQYLAHALWVNGLLLGYAFLVVLARRNFKMILQFFVVHLREKYAPQLKNRDREQISRFLTRVSLPWQQALAHAPFPFFSPSNSIRLYLKTEAALKRAVSPEILAEAVITGQSFMKSEQLSARKKKSAVNSKHSSVNSQK